MPRVVRVVLLSLACLLVAGAGERGGAGPGLGIGRRVPGVRPGRLRARRANGLSDHPYYWAAFVGEGAWR